MTRVKTYPQDVLPLCSLKIQGNISFNIQPSSLNILTIMILDHANENSKQQRAKLTCENSNMNNTATTVNL
jgi:hypothetical protein